MSCKRLLLLHTALFLYLAIPFVCQGQCFPGQPTTAAYATGGSSPYIGDVLWLTWGTTNLSQIGAHPYGWHDRPLGNGSASYASIPLGSGRYLCVEAFISNLRDGGINSYAPGNWTGDYMDDLYNIGGTGSANDLVNGIRNTTVGGRASFTVTCRATLDGAPVRLAGLVLGDAESLHPNEYFNVIADGKWTIVELQKNLAVTDRTYDVSKTNEPGTSRQRINFLRGTNSNTAAVSFLAFNESAYGDGYEVSFDVTLKGEGLTALALGLLTINADGGDAPQSYGAPLHLFEGMVLTDDGIDVGQTVNLNTASYHPGALEYAASTYLGSTGPDADNGPLHSQDALGDDNAPVPSNEEDAWPSTYKQIYYEHHYMPGDILSIDIPYSGEANGYVTGWIDFNLNGTFDADEFVWTNAPANPNGIATLIWTVPQNRVIRNTYIRLRYGSNWSEVSSPINVATGGEVEDHLIHITFPVMTNPMLPSKVKPNSG
ncbi:CshA/CshB family fibrillar adhesin-related protein [Parapedobacter koreensis]|uniref:Uncharacterized protein n=1 Tax=Parapedobacter koreensis TaxID=332977 RepID=A0A1H7QNG1_9SPHI|nr:CshA/CshB family fibrillar adhesin-related protein [Parapedobacter koreensis]SEL49496.1 hypothetical protein SAMN05421740_10625 [Parapedobacter koreensis]